MTADQQRKVATRLKHVVYPEGLPRERGRQVWMKQ